MNATATRVRALNDAFRAAGPGIGPSAGTWLVTAGVEAHGAAFVLEAIGCVQAFDRFDAGNDPYGEHDFGAFDLSGEKLFWKIDCYDLDLRYGSSDPGNPAVTRRVLTLMLASEY